MQEGVPIEATRARSVPASRAAADAPNVPPLDGFRWDIQALRGLAVLLVVLYHARIIVPGGFVGVDVFFVISGFVIGRRLLQRLTSWRGGVMREFYLHRARRILPALAFVLVFVILLTPLLAPIGAYRQATRTGVAAALFSANVYLYTATASGYFATAAELNPLLHTWSLSVEEQFYFVIPALLLGVWYFGRRRWGSLLLARALVVAMVATSLALCVWMSEPGREIGVIPGYPLDGIRFAFFSPFTRAWEFAVGLALVLLPVRWVARGVLRPALAVIGLALVAYAAFSYGDSTVFPGAAAVVPVVGTALVIHAGTRAKRPRTPRQAPASMRPLTWLGDVSYSWYLWHWPLIVFAAAFWPAAGRLPLVVAAVVSVLPAWCSYRFIERRLRATPSSRPRGTVGLAVVCIVAPLAAALVVVPLHRVVDDLVKDRVSAVTDLSYLRAGFGVCNQSLNEAARELCTWGDPDGPSVVLIGDSTAQQLSNALAGAAETTGSDLRIATAAGCPFVGVAFEVAWTTEEEHGPDDCARYTAETLDAIEADPPRVVVVATRTDHWVHFPGFSFIDDETSARVTDPAGRAVLIEGGLARILGRIHDAGSMVVLVDILPRAPSVDLQSCSNLALLVDATRCLPVPFAADASPEVRAANALQARAVERGGATAWDFTDVICPRNRCRSVRNGAIVFYDTIHITRPTSESLIPAATRYLEAALAVNGTSASG